MYNAMYMQRLIRFWGVVGPSSNNQPYWWPDIAYAYASALKSMGVRVIPIGGMILQPEPTWKKWLRLRECFLGELAAKYVNVVCCPPGLPLGTPLTGRELGSVCDYTSAAKHVTAKGEQATSETAYKPRFALAELLTDGVRNIAITTAYRSTADGTLVRAKFDDTELEALPRYDAVLTPGYRDEVRLRALGIKAARCPPNETASAVSHIPSIAEVLDA